MKARVLVTGMGGELGTRVAQLLEARDWATEIVGRRLRAAAPAPAPRGVPAHRPARPRPARASSSRSSRRTAVAHFGVYEPASRMTPASARERTESCTTARSAAAARTGALEYVVRAQRARGVRPPTRSRSRCPTRTPCPPTHAVRALAARGRGRRGGLALRHGVPVGALRYAPVVGSHVPSPLGRLLRLPVVPVRRVLRSAVLAAASRGRGPRDGRRDRAPARRSVQHRRVRRGDAVAGRPARRPRPAAGAARAVGRVAARSRSRAPRSRRTSSSSLRYGCTGDGSRARDVLVLDRSRADAGGAAASSSSGPTSCRSRRAESRSRDHRERSLRSTRSTPRMSRADVDRRPGAPSLAGRYPVDPFGLDPQLAESSCPSSRPRFACASRARSTCPRAGPAVIVSNRGLRRGGTGRARYRRSARPVAGCASRRARRFRSSAARSPARRDRRAAGPTSRPPSARRPSRRAFRSRPHGCVRARAIPPHAVDAGAHARADHSRRGRHHRPVRNAGRSWLVQVRFPCHPRRPVRPRRSARGRALRRSDAAPPSRAARQE